MNDGQLKEQIDRLDTLSAGIVYGREEAWDKLQARMERKPVRKIITFPYRIAAAVAMLLFVCIMGVYLYPAQQETVTKTIKRTTKHIAIVPDQPLQVVQLPVAKPRYETARAFRLTNLTAVPAANNKPANEFAVATGNIAATPTIKETATPENSMPASAVAQMRVVHINELDQPFTTAPPPTDDYAEPAMAVNKMRVVTMGDLKRTEKEEVITISRINRPHGAVLPFTRPIETQNNTAGIINNHALARDPFQIKLNIQN